MTLDGKKLQALSLLSSGMKNAQVACELGLNEKTIRRWLKDDEFINSLKDTKTKIVTTVKADISADISADICTEMRKKRKEHFQRIEEYRQECEDVGSGLLKIGKMGLELALKTMYKLNCDEITSIQQLERLVRVINGASIQGMELKAESLGIQPLVNVLNQVATADESQ